MRPADITSDLTTDILRTLVRYCPETGKFFWLVSNNQCTLGSEAGSIENTKYIRITVRGRRYQAHRLAWLYMTGGWPKARIDHRDLDRKNNKWSNLREADDSKNRANTRARPDNKLNIKGVGLHVCGKYQARIFKDNKFCHLGLFDTAQEASAAYAKAAEEVFGEFARIK